MSVMQNTFFNLALAQAAKMIGKPARIIRLLGQLAIKIKRTDLQAVNRATMKQQILRIGRLLKAQVTGKYRVKSLRFLLILLAAIIYFINPIDLIPDFILGFGLTDDLAILTWVYQAAAEELKTFVDWEKISQSNATLNKDAL
jgi:uncharacterized membrane protein YkvA (DUF1232 family)